MIPPTAPFDQSFDSIEVDPSTAPTREALDYAFALCEPADATEGRPGFYLLDDAGGRFIVDRDFGVISLKDEALLERERGHIHTTRLQVIEPSGAAYELELRLGLSGLIPHVVGCEDDLCLSPHPEISASALERQKPVLPWAKFAAATGEHSKASLYASSAAFGAVLAPETAASVATHGLIFVRTAAVLESTPAHASWPS